MSSFIRYMGLFHISYWNKLFISRQADVCNAQWPHCNKEIKSLIYEEYMHDTFGDIGLRHLICRRYVCHWHFLQLQTHICSHFSVVMCHGCLYCFTGLAVSWSPYSAHTYIPRLLHCSDCFTVSTRCTYTDLGSRWYFGVYFRSCLRVCVCVWGRFVHDITTKTMNGHQSRFHGWWDMIQKQLRIWYGGKAERFRFHAWPDFFTLAAIGIFFAVLSHIVMTQIRWYFSLHSTAPVTQYEQITYVLRGNNIFWPTIIQWKRKVIP